MSVTTAEAAALVGVSVRTVQGWVAKGYLAPCNPLPRGRARAQHWVSRFVESEVVECAHARRSKAWHDAVDEIARTWRLALEDETA